MEFDLGPRYVLGLNPIDRDFHDLDGDGNLDIVVVNGGQENPDPTITIRYGIADGSFEPPVVFSSILIGHAIAVGDLNNDGRPDIVAASWYQNAIGVFHNLGGRQFSAPFITIPPDRPYPVAMVGEFFHLAIGDFDGDGNNDVAAVQDQINQRFRFFKCSPSGLLTPIKTFDQIGTDTSYEREMSVGDLNGDGRPDLILAGGGPFGTRHFSFIFGRPAGEELVQTYGFNVEDKAVGIRAKDIDSDGDQDIVVVFLDTTTPTRHSVQIFRNDGSGNFTALPKIFLEHAFPPNDISVDDLNNDGKQDIAVLLGSVYNAGVMVMTMHGNGDGAFASEKFYAASSSHAILTADVNKDGKVDILTASSDLLQSDYSAYGDVSNSSLSVLFNKDLTSFKAPKITLWGGDFIDEGDFDGNGFKDIASAWSTNFTALSDVVISLNDRAGGLLSDVGFSAPFALNGIRTGDFNGDGKSDVISIHEDNSRVLALHRGVGNGQLLPPITRQFSRGLSRIGKADFNGDSIDDIIVIDDTWEVHVLLGSATGIFSTGGLPFTLSNHVGIDPIIGDFNNDGRSDVVLPTGSTLRIWIGDGLGGLTQSPEVIQGMGTPVAGDFNGDGNLDLAGMTGVPPGPLPPWRTDAYLTGIAGNGNGGFAGTFSVGIMNFSHSTVQSMISSDFDGDGFDDVAMIMKDNTFGNLIVVPSNGSEGMWRDPVFYGVGTAMRKLVAGDFNGDGKPDIAFLGDNARGILYNIKGKTEHKTPFDFDGDGKADVSVWRPEVGTWYLKRSLLGDVGVAWGGAADKPAVGDYDGDGVADVTVFRDGLFYVNGSTAGHKVIGWGAAADKPVPGDYDGDGKTDAAVYRDGSWWILRSGDGGYDLNAFGTATDKPVQGDYDGDGKTDVAIFRDGQWWVDRSSGGIGVTSWGQANDKPVPADYDGDGKTDMAVFRNGTWWILKSSGGYDFIEWGIGTDRPVPADYDGDGKADLAVARDGVWWILKSSTNGAYDRIEWGFATDRPIPELD